MLTGRLARLASSLSLRKELRARRRALARARTLCLAKARGLSRPLSVLCPLLGCASRSASSAIRPLDLSVLTLLVKRLILILATLLSSSGTLGLSLLSKLIRRTLGLALLWIRRPPLSLSSLRELRSRTLRRTNRIVSSLGMDGPLCPVRFWPLLLLCLVSLFLLFLCITQALSLILRQQALFLQPAPHL